MHEKPSLLFLTRYRLDEPFSLRFKFDSQLKAFNRMGLDCSMIGYDKSGFYLIHGEERTRLCTAHTDLPQYEHLFFFMEFGRAIQKAAALHPEYDYAYFRETPGFFTLHRGLMRLCARTRIICEIPTYNANGTTGEKQHGLRALFVRYGNFWKKRDAKAFSLYALIGAENPVGKFNGKPSVNIRNGIDMAALPVREPKREAALHLLALGSMGKWHGFDRVIRSAAAYQGDIPYVLHLAGGNDGGCLPQWQSLAEALHCGEHVVFEGPCYGDRLNALFDLCDVGISSLAAFRNGAERLYSLKLREYLARGLPVLYAADDPALETDPTAKVFCMVIPNDESIPDWESVLRFAQQTREQPALPQTIRAFAETHFTWESQFEKVFAQLIRSKKEKPHE